MKKSTAPISTLSLQQVATRKRTLFIKIIKDEFLRELLYLLEVINERAKPRDTLTKKVLAPITDIASAIPTVGTIVKAFSRVSDFTTSYFRDEKIALLAPLQHELDLTRLSILLDVVAREAWRRYESFIVDRLSDDPEVGVVPFAKVGAKRMIERLFHEAKAGKGGKKELVLNESLLLAGLVEGRSGSWIDGFFNNTLQLKRLKTRLLRSPKAKTSEAEDVYGRAGLRQLEIRGNKIIDKIYVRRAPKFYDLSEWKKRPASMNRNSEPVDHFGAVRFRTKSGCTHDPKVGYVLMPSSVITKRYEFAEQDFKVLSSALQVELKSSSHSVMLVDRATVSQYLVWAKTSTGKGQGLVDYVREVLKFPLIQQVACAEDLSELTLTGANLSHTDLSGAILSGDLSGINFSDSYLVATQFKNVTRAHHVCLRHAHCEYLQAEGVDFQQSDLTQANFTYAQLKKSNITGCQILGTIWFETDLTGMITDTDALREQKAQTTRLKGEMREQRRLLTVLTDSLYTQLESVQATQQQLLERLTAHTENDFTSLAMQVQQLLQHHESRIVFEVQCQQELGQLRDRAAQSSDAPALKQLQAELSQVQAELKALHHGTNWQAAIEELQTVSTAQFKGLNETFSKELITLETRLRHDYQQQFSVQEKRLDKLQSDVQTLWSSLTKRIAALEVRVDAIEAWMKTATLELAAQQSEKVESKRVTQELQTALQSLQQQLQAQRAEQQAQQEKILQLQQQATTAADSKIVSELKDKLNELKAKRPVADDAKKAPDTIPSAVKNVLDELQRQRSVLEKAAINSTLRSSLQPKIEKLATQQAQWEKLQKNFTEQWTLHCSTQEAAIQNLQDILGEAYFACDQRLKQLEADVSALKSWASETQERLMTLESEEGATKTQLKTLQEQLTHWIKQQEAYQTKLTSVSTMLSNPDKTPDQKQTTQLQTDLTALETELQTRKPSEIYDHFKLTKNLYRTQQEDVTSALQEVDEELRATLTSTVSELADKIKTLDSMEERFTTLETGAIARLQSDTASLKDKLTALEGRVKDLEDRVQPLEDITVHITHDMKTRNAHYTLAVRLKKLRDVVLTDPFISEELAYYIAPNGQRFPGTDTSSPLQPWVETNFLKNDTRILLLQGAGGSGKSTFNRHLLCQLWQDPAWEKFTPGDKPPKAFVPLFVPLGSNKVDPRNLFNYLHDLPELVAGFTDAEIGILKTEYQILWIADGYDEMPGNVKINLYDTNNLARYKGRIKLLISRRSDPLSAVDERAYFMPSSDSSVTQIYQNYFVAPFTGTQISDYITQYLQKKQLMQKGGEELLLWDDVATYQKHFSQITGIKQLIEVPFLLMIAVEILPGIVAEVEREQAKQPKKIGQSSKIELTRKKLLGGFVDNWFQRQATKKGVEYLHEPRDLLGDDVVNDLESSIHADFDIQVCLLKAGYLLFCQEFAKNLQSEKRVSVIYPDEKRTSRFKSIEDTSTSLSTPVSPSSSWIKTLFDPEDKDMGRCMRGSPLHKAPVGQGRIEYGFMHGLLVDYFVSTILGKDAEAKAKQTQTSQPLPSTIVPPKPALSPTSRQLPLPTVLPRPSSSGGGTSSTLSPSILSSLSHMVLGKSTSPRSPSPSSSPRSPAPPARGAVSTAPAGRGVPPPTPGRH